uniref:Kunitz/Bovine pancreatic trypsin inhibitor domain protein n=1 Tax=Angiostrongylus cantonensis TaxID=6313 RepID=A0A158P937_ANGCA
MLILILGAAIMLSTASPRNRWCSQEDRCDSCTIRQALGAKCAEDDDSKIPFLFCNPRTKRIDVDTSSYLMCSDGIYRQKLCSNESATHFSPSKLNCVDPASLNFHIQGTSGKAQDESVMFARSIQTVSAVCTASSGVADASRRTLPSMLTAMNVGISPSESGCFYDVQCSVVWPGAYCKSGQCQCPSEDMMPIKTKDGTFCLWVSTAEPSCPLPSLPPPDSAAAVVVLPAPLKGTTMGIAKCNPYASSLPINDKMLLADAHEHKCAVRGTVGQDTSAHPVGVCCMNRAFTCQQPKRGEAHELGAVPRWWFNSVVGSCQQFLFDPSSTDVSPNNFETLHHCESFCRDTCLRGNPAYVSMRTNVGQVPQDGCSMGQPCSEPFNCVDVGSQSLCCPSRKVICSESGGRARDPNRSVPYDAGMSIAQLAYDGANHEVGVSTRYYYNPIDGQCHPFTYNGFLGNFNNFHTQTDCQMFCSRLQCTHGNPLTIGHSIPQRCDRDGDCPSTHRCTLEYGVCCPSPQTLCTEPLRVGDCKQSIRQFWYNAETRSCESFFYTGCQGNNNRFDSLNECQSYCANISAEPRCPQGRAYADHTGKFQHCGDSHGMRANCPTNYECHFDGFIRGCCPSKVFTCSLQLNKGIACGSGSSYRYYYNNKLKKCQSYCEVAVCPHGGSPLKGGSTMRSCSTADPCPSGYECNRLDSNGAIHKRCCPTKTHICSKPPQIGKLTNCGNGNNQTMFYFNVVLRNCSPYLSNGCDTSLNSFKTRVECENFCFSANCNPGDTIYRDLIRVTLKSLQASAQWVKRRSWIRSVRLLVIVQWRATADAHPVTCVDFHSPGKNTSVVPVLVECEMGHGRNGCPPLYSCQSEILNAFQGYCCSQNLVSYLASFLFNTAKQSTLQMISLFLIETHCLDQIRTLLAICPGGTEFHIDERTQMPTTCLSEGYGFCPQCSSSNSRVKYSTITDGCPPGHVAYTVDSEVKNCDPFNISDSSCPYDYSCQWSVMNQNYQCCRSQLIPRVKPNLTDDGCPRKQFALLDRETNEARLCTAGQENSCPTGFFCQFSRKKSQFQCCGQNEGSNMCVDGYECVRSAYYIHKNICCSKEDNECEKGEKMIAGRCIRQVKVGGICRLSEECTGDSKCKANTCV